MSEKNIKEEEESEIKKKKKKKKEWKGKRAQLKNHISLISFLPYLRSLKKDECSKENENDLEINKGTKENERFNEKKGSSKEEQKQKLVVLGKSEELNFSINQTNSFGLLVNFYMCKILEKQLGQRGKTLL